MLRIIVTAAAILLPGAALAEDWASFYAEVYGGAAIGTEIALGPVLGAEYQALRQAP